ncbi:DUF2254 domain-containing protein [Sphingomonas sp. CGMCC 1.13654]|uniref:DUF2254 domain-containing protein n=1 Tax=Sphingomonas chungangi TaxID=2683589 RepID=A0A838L840_9SPHN|nr:DUF2254 domain-containing protein [Sphingomonas chungangi]MBA2935187.1 DUF2254 domain-containing protein [Sphingomonas chungangi]MVW55265.1 DUF2254 domain-containing protein [Sphingomonas chungangi]
MRAWLLTLTDRLRESYWFIPTIMAVMAILLAGGMITLDSYQGSNWMDGVPWLYAARPDGARSLLSSIGGSMIGVAGTTFSVTIAAVVYASGQYGPRLLSNFMSDRGNQVTLGTFIATFVYSMVVLRTIRSPGESGAGADAFVPQLALLVAVLLVLCSIGVLIFFIHHVPTRIHINSVIEEIGDRLLAEIGARFPVFIGAPLPAEARSDEDRIPDAFRRDAGSTQAVHRKEIEARQTGYLQLIDDETLLSVATRHDLVLRLQYQPGDFVHVGRALVEACPPEKCDDDAVAAIRGCFAVGSRRTPLQDLRFLIDELVEIAARALSPGVNDPFTASTCLDWLGAALADVARRSLPSRLRADEKGALRVIAHPVDFAGFMDRGFGALAQYASQDRIAALRFLGALGEVAMSCDNVERLGVVRAQVDQIEELATGGLDGEPLRLVMRRSAELRRALAEPDYRRQLRDSAAWLGGTA